MSALSPLRAGTEAPPTAAAAAARPADARTAAAAAPLTISFQPAAISRTSNSGEMEFTYYVNKTTGEFVDQLPSRADPHDFETFTVSAKGMPSAITPEIAKQYWQTVVAGMQHELPPGKAAEVEVNTQNGTLTCVMPRERGKQSVQYTEFADASINYANGRPEELAESLNHLQASLREGTPLYSSAAPPHLAYGNQNCYLQAALQRLLADPILLRQLNEAPPRQRDPRKREALEAIQRLVHTCVNRPGEVVSARELETVRQALADIAPTDSPAERAQAAAVRQREPEDAATAFTRMKQLIGEGASAAGQPALVTTLTLEGAAPSVTENQDGELHLHVPAGQRAIQLPELIAANRTQKNPRRDPVKRGSTQHIVTEEKYQLTDPGLHLSGTIAPNPRGVIPPCRFVMAAEDYVRPGDDNSRTYQLSCVTLFAGAHYTTLTRKQNRDGSYSSYYRNGERESAPMDDERCARFLEQHATQVVSFDYFQPAVLQTAMAQSPKIARRFQPAPTANAQPEEEIPGVSEMVINPERTVHNKESGKAVTYARVKGDVKKTDTPTVVEFTDETLSNSTVRAHAAARRALTALGGKLPPKRWGRTVDTIPIRKGTRTTVLVNPGTTEESLRDAVQGVLQTHAKEGGHIAFPLPNILTTAKALSIVEQEIIRFSSKTKYNVKVKVILTEKQAKETEEAPSAPAAPAALEYVASIAPKGWISDYKPITFTMNEAAEAPADGIGIPPGLVKQVDGEIGKRDVLQTYFNRQLAQAKRGKKRDIAFVCTVDKEHTINQIIARAQFEAFIQQLSSQDFFENDYFRSVTLTFVRADK